MKKIVFITILSTLFIINSFANNNKVAKTSGVNVKATEIVASASVQSTFGVSGTILDIANNEALAGATVVVEGKKYYSDLDGKFNIPSLSQGVHRFTVEFISYNNSEVEVNVKENSSVTIRLAQK